MINKNFYNIHPLEPIYESLQNYGTPNIDKLSDSELKEEYKQALVDRLDLLEDNDAGEGEAPSFALKEQIENADKYISKLKTEIKRRCLDKKEIEKIENSVKSRYNKKKEEDEEE